MKNNVTLSTVVVVVIAALVVVLLCKNAFCVLKEYWSCLWASLESFVL